MQDQRKVIKCKDRELIGKYGFVPVIDLFCFLLGAGYSCLKFFKAAHPKRRKQINNPMIGFAGNDF